MMIDMICQIQNYWKLYFLYFCLIKASFKIAQKSVFYNNSMIKIILIATISIIVNTANPTLTGSVTTQSGSEIAAVLAGFPTTASSIYASFDNLIWRLDAQNQGWGAAALDNLQWIQVSSIQPVLWTAVVTQGKESANQWVSQFTVSYTENGLNWFAIDNGRVFKGNTDATTHVRNDFNTKVYARAIRINPTKYKDWIGMRFDAIFVSY